MKHHDNDWNLLKGNGSQNEVFEEMMEEFKIVPSEDFKERSFNTALQGIDEARKKANQKKRGRAKTRAATIGLSAAAILFSFTLVSTTEQGQAVVSHIRQLFEPEKTAEREIEGMTEQTDVNLHAGDSVSNLEADFAIYIDEERYNVVKEKGVFRIEADIPDDYPEVFMEITQQVDVNPKDAITSIKDEISSKYDTVSEIEPIKEPVVGYQFRANNGSNWNSEVVVYYVIGNELSGSFTIKQQYFLEAAEGHGARFYQMLKDFTIVPKDVEG